MFSLEWSVEIKYYANQIVIASVAK